MKIRIRFFASFREIARERERFVDVPSGTTASGLLATLARETPALEGIRSSTIFAVNGDYVSGDRVLQEGDEVAFIPPVSGGQVHPRVKGQGSRVRAHPSSPTGVKGQGSRVRAHPSSPPPEAAQHCKSGGWGGSPRIRIPLL